MGQALWRLPPRQQQQLQEELADRLADRGGRREQGRDGGPQRRAPQHCYGPDIYHLLRMRMGGKEQHGFIDLEMLPPELGITILSYLNATDLCLAGCVWQDLGNDEYLWQGRDVLDELVTLHNFSNQFLPNALRDFFRHIHAPEERGEYLETLITKFSHSLILLSIDLTSPHVKNKMSKREFIRNTRRAAHNVSDDFVGHLYDNIYLIGHVAA
ncbi:F-box only protein 8 F-box/SEC7 protein FBS [Collichthys lucidus]|uniref:F-box only protein 8 F-box/SEC7 protein FBS n=1 Tax=Collichthys lucidus TaxID=240159 RepID=A0A4U5U6D3_COLLU|nr:F-box only protein 8 F-box/SEC7 protein FBS [Collichthys lucidus]